MFKLALQKAEEPEIRLTTSVRSSKKQESSRKTSMSALLTMPKLLIVFSLVQLLSRVRLFVTPWTTARQASLFITNSRILDKPMSIESLMPSSHLILHSPRLLPSIFPNIRVFSHESALSIRWPKYWTFSFSIIPSKEIPGLISFRMDWLDLLAVHSKGDQSWVFIGRTDFEAETPIFWLPDVKSWLIWKDSDVGKDWRQEKGTTEDEMVRWHHQLNGHEFG